MVKLSEISVFYPDLPDYLDGLTILHVSDMHTRRFGPREQQLHEVMQQGCDLLLCSGDTCFQFSFTPFENKHGEALDGWSLSCRGLILAPQTDKAVNVWRKLLTDFPCRLGIFMVQGNHDSPDFMNRIQELNVNVLNNQCRLVNLDGPDGPKINICGAQCMGRQTADIPKTLAGIDPDYFSIGLCHYPEMAEPLTAGGCQLVLAGHTHGGQVCLPSGRPLITHSQTGRKYLSGLESTGPGYVHTTRGLGKTFIPIRIFCPPEIARITLRHRAPK